MSRLKSFHYQDLGPGVVSRPAPEIVIEGDPCFTLWSYLEGSVEVGVWAATPGAHRMARDARTWEQFQLLEGEIEITEEGQDPRRFRAGDTVIVEPNFRGTWRTIAPVRKVYISMTR